MTDWLTAGISWGLITLHTHTHTCILLSFCICEVLVFTHLVWFYKIFLVGGNDPTAYVIVWSTNIYVFFHCVRTGRIMILYFLEAVEQMEPVSYKKAHNVNLNIKLWYIKQPPVTGFILIRLMVSSPHPVKTSYRFVMSQWCHQVKISNMRCS